MHTAIGRIREGKGDEQVGVTQVVPIVNLDEQAEGLDVTTEVREVYVRCPQSSLGVQGIDDRTVRPMVVGATVTALGVQTVLLSLVCAMFQMRRDAMGAGGARP